MAGMWGMDTTEVRSMATQFNTQADAVDAVVTVLDPLVNNTEIWKGPDAEAFRGNWESTHKMALNNCATALREAATSANTNADKQEAVSNES